MKLLNFKITNFKSWQQLDLHYKQGLTILIGKNNSGKSNIFKSIKLLFFIIKNGKSGVNIDKSLWYRNNPKDPIKIEANFKIEEIEIIDQLFGAGFQCDELKVSAKIINDQEEHMSYNIDLISPKIDRRISLEKLGDKLVFIPADRGIKNEESLNINIKESFDGRDIKNYLHKLKMDRLESWRFKKIQEALIKIMPEFKLDVFLDSNNVDLSIKEINSEDNFDSVITDCGSGLIDILIIVTNIIARDDCIFLIEEPEIHLHPEGQRKLLTFLKENSKTKQILIATHSPIFIDSITSNLLLVKKELKSELMEINIGEIKLIKEELNIKPSDSLINSNVVMLVEGETDKIFMENIIRKSRPELLIKGMSIYPTNGKDRIILFEKFIKKTVDIPLIVMGDSDFIKDKEGLIKQGFLVDNLFLLEKGELEDYYPINRIIATIKIISDGKINLTDEELSGKRIYSYVSKKCQEAKINIDKRKFVSLISNDLSVEELDNVFSKILDKCSRYLIT